LISFWLDEGWVICNLCEARIKAKNWKGIWRRFIVKHLKLTGQPNHSFEMSS